MPHASAERRNSLKGKSIVLTDRNATTLVSFLRVLAQLRAGRCWQTECEGPSLVQLWEMLPGWQRSFCLQRKQKSSTEKTQTFGLDGLCSQMNTE